MESSPASGASICLLFEHLSSRNDFVTVKTYNQKKKEIAYKKESTEQKIINPEVKENNNHATAVSRQL